MASNASFLNDISQNKGMQISRTGNTAQQLSEAINGNVLRDVFLNGNWGDEKPIFKDVFEGNIKNIQEYLKQSRNRIDIKSIVCNGLSLFQIAILGGNLEVVKLLVNSQREKLKAFTNDEQNMAILTALDHKYENIAKFLIEQGVYTKGSSSQSKLTPLMLAASNGYSEIVEQMVSKNLIRKSDINAANSKGDTALMLAAKCGSSNSSYSTVIKEPDHFDKQAREHREMTINPISDLTTEQPLSAESTTVVTSNSILSHYEKIVEILLKKEADPLPCNRNGRNALMCAAIGGSVKIVQLLLNIDDVKKHINDISKELFTASWYSLLGHHEAIFFLLYKAGADPSILGKDFKLSPLNWAMNLTRNIKIFETFLEKNLILMKVIITVILPCIWQ